MALKHLLSLSKLAPTLGSNFRRSTSAGARFAWHGGEQFTSDLRAVAAELANFAAMLLATADGGSVASATRYINRCQHTLTQAELNGA